MRRVAEAAFALGVDIGEIRAGHARPAARVAVDAARQVTRRCAQVASAMR